MKFHRLNKHHHIVRSASALLALLLIECVVVAQSHAAIFILAAGGQIEGELLNPDENPRRVYIVKTLSGGRVTLSTNQVKQMVSQTALEKRYVEILPRMPATADGNWLMAEWCNKYGLKEHREQHLKQIIELDPEHKDARRALGYSQVDGNWIRADEFMAEQGYVRYKGGWRLQQEIEIEKLADEQEQKVIDVRRKVKMWRDWILTRPSKRAEGLQELRGIRDPLAAASLAEFLTDDKGKDPRESKLIYIDLLGKLKTSVGVKAFAHIAMHSPDQALREAVNDELEKFGGAIAVPLILTGLSDSDNKIVNRAGTALGRIGDPEATKPLIEALITEHKFVFQEAGRTNVGFSKDGSGGGGLSTGGGPKVIKKDIPNTSVLAALQRLYPGVTYQYNKEAWHDWYADSRTPKDVDLRRGY